ncbi:MAG: LysR family transcriptional regulator [Deltaproteobacteria bacterium]|nr:LysR family transcriptional regulator [Deltaproteobacteria bacterium]
MQLPSIESLRCFVEAARQLNFRSAARLVGLTPAALGQRIRQLEELWETALFVRTTRSVRLTNAGLALLPQAQATLDAAAKCRSAAIGTLEPPPVQLTLGTRHELGNSWLLPMLGAIKRQHPELTVSLYFGSGIDLLSRVRTMDIDCAVTSSRLTDPKLDAYKLHQEDYVFVGSPKLLKRLPLKKPEDAKHHVLIDTEYGLPLFRYWRDAPGGIDSMEFGQLWPMGTISAIRYLVLREEGLAVLPKYYVDKDLASKRLVEVLPQVRPLCDHFRLVYRSDDPRTALYRDLAATMNSQPLK